MEYSEYKKRSDTQLNRRESSNKEIEGYRESEFEKQNNEQPVNTLKLCSANGTFSAGINRHKQVTVAVCMDTTQQLRESHKQVDMQTSKKVKTSDGNIYFNSHDPVESATVFKSQIGKKEKVLQNNIDKISNNDVINTMLPFLKTNETKEQIRQLECNRRQALEDKDSLAMQNFDKELEQERNNLQHQENCKMQLFKNLKNNSKLMSEKAASLEREYNKNAQSSLVEQIVDDVGADLNSDSNSDSNPESNSESNPESNPESNTNSIPDSVSNSKKNPNQTKSNKMAKNV